MDPNELYPRDHRGLSHKASQETFISLVQLDPEPILDAYQQDGADFDPTKDASPSSDDAGEGGSLADSIHLLKSSGSGGTAGGIGLGTGTTPLGLSGSGHGAIYYLTRIQRYSSYTFSLFGALHLATTSVIPLLARSVPASESYLLLAREIYQTPLSEPLLVTLPIVAHVGAGLLARLLRRRQNLKRYYGVGSDEKTHGLIAKPTARFLRSGWPRLSWIALSGYVSTLAVATHAFMNRGLPLMVEGDSANIGLAYVAHGFVRHPWTSWVAYAALLGVGCGHMVWGWAKWFGVSQGAGWKLERHTGVPEVDRTARRRRRRRLILINAVAVAATALWAAGGLGVVARGGETLGWVGKIYDGLYDMVPFFA